MSVVKYHPVTREFVAEEPPVVSQPDVSLDALRVRVRQQEILAEFGVLALRGTPFADLLQEATRAAAEGLGAEFAKVLQFMPDTSRFLVCAGVGWDHGVVGVATVGADSASPAGYALQTGKAVISNHLDLEERFRTPELLLQYGIRRAMNVILGGDDVAFGVLEVDSRSEGEFSESDIVFLRGLANILGMAIERQKIEEDLHKAVDRQHILMREVNHRVNNSLQIVAGMLRVHASGAASDDVQAELRQASNRIAAVGRAHQRLYKGDVIGALDLGQYLGEVCSDIAASIQGCEIDVSAVIGAVIPTDRAIPAALLVNELITNAVKYAYATQSCKIWVSLILGSANTAVISVRDEGIGLPPGFDMKAGRLGMRLIRAFADQLRGNLQVVRKTPGTEFILTFPLHL
jgi:two-component sensor histidine kinase